MTDTNTEGQERHAAYILSLVDFYYRDEA